MTRLTIGAVEKAVSDLQMQGKPPTNQNIVTYLGHGSFSTLTKLRKLHPAAFGLDTVQNTLNTVQNTVIVDERLVNALWERIEQRLTVFNTDNTVQNTDNTIQNTVQAKLNKAQADLDQQEKEIARLRIEKDELSIELAEQLESATSQKALAKLVFLVTTGCIDKMLGNKELGEMIDLSPDNISQLKRKGNRISNQ